MMKTMMTPKKLPLAALGLLLLGFQTGCNAVAERNQLTEDQVRTIVQEEIARSNEAGAEVSTQLSHTPGNATTGRSSYKTVAIPEDAPSDPFAAAAAGLDSLPTQIDECFSLGQVSIYPLDPEQTDHAPASVAVVLTQLGACDDSRAGVEQRADYSRDDQGQWQLEWGGERTACGRGEQAWTTELCP
jgi:hypothetical protein